MVSNWYVFICILKSGTIIVKSVLNVSTIILILGSKTFNQLSSLKIFLFLRSAHCRTNAGEGIKKEMKMR